MSKHSSEATERQGGNRSRTLFILLLAASLVGTGAVLYHNGKQETPGQATAEPDGWAEELEAWAKKFPLQYESYLRTVDQVKTGFGGSEIVLRMPDHEDPRSSLTPSHPEFEMWRQGLHARSGVACADCHMPYRREGSPPVTDHHVRSPLLNIKWSCQSCHKWAEEEARRRAESIQERTSVLRDEAVDVLVDFIRDLRASRASGRVTSDLAEALDYQRRAQFYLDFVEAENSTGMHASQEAARILNESLRYSRLGRKALLGIGD